MKPHKKTALSGMLTALAVVILLIGAIVRTLDLSAAGAAALIIVYAMIELGKKYAFLIYAATSLLGLLLLPDKSSALIFAVFAGFYPIFKGYLQKIRSRFLSYAAKFTLFNICLTLILLTGRFLFKIEDELYEFQIILYGALNIAFFIYDFALDKLVTFYFVKFRGRFGNINSNK